MARKRLLSPEFFLHGELYDAEYRCGLPLRLAFAGLWTATDRRGLFTWKPRELKLSILPHDPVDFELVLNALESAGFVERYVVDGKQYGRIPSFTRWQTFHKNEKPSNAPEPSVGCAEPSDGGVESDNIGVETSGTGTVVVAVAGTVTSTVAVAGVVAVADSPKEPTTATPDFVQVLTADFDFGPFEPAIVGICRSSKHGQAVIATLRMHLSGELGHEHATPRQLGLAAQQFLASGSDFNASYFAGFVRRAKQGIERIDNRKRNASETRFLEADAAHAASREREERDADTLIERFASDHPDRYAELQRAADAAVSKTFSLGRDVVVRQHLLKLVREAAA